MIAGEPWVPNDFILPFWRIDPYRVSAIFVLRQSGSRIERVERDIDTVVVAGIGEGESDLLQNPATRAVLRVGVGDKLSLISGVEIGGMPLHQRLSKLGREALSPHIASEGVAEFAIPPVYTESSASDHDTARRGHAPLRPAARSLFVEILAEPGRRLCPGLDAPADIPHRDWIGVQLQQFFDVLRQPGRDDEAFR